MLISVIIPVMNETAGINGLIAHLRGIEPKEQPEIIVVDGEHDGSTIKEIKDRTVITLVSEAGRAVQMNRGAELARGGILLFLHADTLLPDNAFERIRSALRNGSFVGGAFSLGIRTDRKIFRITERYVALRTHLTRVPFGDQGIFLNREYFERIGGYRSIPLMEDVELMGRIRKRGDRICILPERIMTSARRWEKEGVVYATLRNWSLQLLYLLGVSPERLVRFYRP